MQNIALGNLRMKLIRKKIYDEARERGDVEDLEDGRIAVKVRPPKKKRRLFKIPNNFVVPGFDLNKSEIRERE